MIWLIAQSAGNPDSVLAPIYGLGAVGAVFILMLIGLIWPKPGVDQLKQTITEKDKQIDLYKAAWEIERDALIALQQDKAAQIEHQRFVEKVFEELRARANS